MRDAITGLIGRYDQLGRYLDRDAIDRISSYFSEAQVRLAAVELINREATELVREAAQRLWLEDPELILPGGNAYTTRRLSACLRDMDYFLRRRLLPQRHRIQLLERPVTRHRSYLVDHLLWVRIRDLALRLHLRYLLMMI